MKLKSRLGYGIGIFGPMLGWVAAGQFLLYYYTDVIGLSPAQAGLVMLIGMVWDAITDPIVGYLADRTRTRWGRYRPYLLFSGVPLGVTMALAFFPPTMVVGTIFATALATHLLFRTGFTLVYMPYTAMIARLTSSYDSRTELTAVKTTFVFLANLSISFGFFALATQLGGGSEQAGFFRAACVIGGVAAITTLLCFAVTKEPPPDEERDAKSSANLLQAFGDMARNRPFMMVFVGVAVTGGFYSAEISMVAYIAKYWLGDAAHTSTLFTTQAIASLASIPVWLWVGKRFGKREVWVTGLCMSAGGLLAIYFIRPETVELMAGLYGIINAGATGFILIFYALTADTVDWGEWKQGRRHEGVMFGSISFANKAFGGLATATLATLLGWSGFQANVEQGPEVLEAMFTIGTLIPAIAILAAALLMLRYPISRTRHEEILSGIQDNG